MDYEYQSPGFTAEGVEPPASLKSEGFKPGYKPPAAYFTWFWTRVSKCITELQTKLSGAAYKSLNNVDDATFLEKARAAGVGIQIVSAASTDGVAYTAQVNGVTELYNGLTVTIIPQMTSTSTQPTININNLGAVPVRQPLSFNTAAMTMPKLDTFLVEGRPVTVQYDANYVAGGMFKFVDKPKTSAQDLYGMVPIESGGTGASTAAEALKNLGVVDLIYPVGSIYINASATASPARLFGGVWEIIEDVFLLAASADLNQALAKYPVGSTGGEETHLLTEEEMPGHLHVARSTDDGNANTFLVVEETAPVSKIRVEKTETSDPPEYALTSSVPSKMGTMPYTSSSGGNQPHNNMPPYLAVCVWKRVK